MAGQIPQLCSEWKWSNITDLLEITSWSASHQLGFLRPLRLVDILVFFSCLQTSYSAVGTATAVGALTPIKNNIWTFFWTTAKKLQLHHFWHFWHIEEWWQSALQTPLRVHIFFDTHLFQLWSRALLYVYFKGTHSLTLHIISTDLSVFEHSLQFSQTEQDIVLLTVCWIRLKLFPWELYACSNRILSSMLHSSGVW